MLRRRMRARFQPTRVDNLRPELAPLIGEVVEWRCFDYGEADARYPGQYRWTTDDERWQGWWVPDEDLAPEAPSHPRARPSRRASHGPGRRCPISTG